MGFCNTISILVYGYLSPGITAVNQPIDELGKEVANQLFLLMDGKFPKEKGAIFPTKIIVRESCKAPKKSD